jgi:hypothetical protein
VDANVGTAVGAGGTICRTSNGGTTWTVQPSGTEYSLYGVSFRDANIGTVVGEGGTILRTTTGGVVWVQDGSPVEMTPEFVLRQNYPNPFNPSTTIMYDLPKDSRVSLKVFDILGREVTTLVNEDQKAGRRSVEWNAIRLSSGVYFYRLEAGNFVSVKKLLLLK